MSEVGIAVSDISVEVETAKLEQVRQAIVAMSGVHKAESSKEAAHRLEADISLLESLLKDLGFELQRLEDSRNLNCPLRDMRERIERHVELPSGFIDPAGALCTGREGKPDIKVWAADPTKTAEHISLLKNVKEVSTV